MKLVKKVIFIFWGLLIFGGCDIEPSEIQHPVHEYMPDYELALSTDDPSNQISDDIVNQATEYFLNSEKQFELGSDSSEQFFGAITDLETDSQGNVYILDDRTFSITKFHPNGKLLVRHGGVQGRGPDDLFRPIAIKILNDNTLLQSDYPHPFKSYDVTKDKLEFLRTYEPQKVIVTDFCLMNKEIYVRTLAENPSTQDTLDHNLIHVFSQDSVGFIRAFADMYKSPRNLTNQRLSGGLSGKVICAENKNSIIYTFENFNYIYATDPFGELKWVTHLTSLSPPPTKERVKSGETVGWSYRFLGDTITSINRIFEDFLLVQVLRNGDYKNPEIISFIVNLENGFHKQLEEKLPWIIHVNRTENIFYTRDIQDETTVSVWENGQD